MASTYSDRLRLEKQADGENPNSWGQILNENVIELIDEAVASYTVVSVSSAGVTLSEANGTTDQSRSAALEFAGTLTANVTITIPAEEKLYFVRENTTGSFAVTMKTPSGTALPVTQQSNIYVACDGTDLHAITAPLSVDDYTINELTVVSAATINGSFTAQQVSSTGLTTGVVSATSAVFTGQVSSSGITTGHVSSSGITTGVVSATSGVFSGQVSTAGITTGQVSSTGITTGVVSATSAVFTGQVSSAGITTGQVSSTGITTGVVSATSGIFTGTVSASTLDATTGSFTTVNLTNLNIIPSGTYMLFQQTAAPTGWTKETTHDNKALRVVTGTASSGGSVDFTTAFASQAVTGTTDGSGVTITGSVASYTLTESDIPAHTHFIAAGTAADGTGGIEPDNYLAQKGNYGNTNNYIVAGISVSATEGLTSETGGDGGHTHSAGTLAGGSHTHTFTGSAINLAVEYVDIIIASKD